MQLPSLALLYIQRPYNTMTAAMPAPAACSLLLLLLLVAPVAAGECVIDGVPWAAWANRGQLTEGLVIPEHTFSAFIFDLSVGQQALSVVMDISSELIWVQCGPGLRRTPTFLPDNSRSFAPIAPCPSSVRNNPGSFGQIHYADRRGTCHPGDHGCAARCGYAEHIYAAGNTSGYLATETFGMGNRVFFTGMVFGCSDNVTLRDGLDGVSGFVGFSRGPLSLVSQRQISRFSYFFVLPDDPDNGKAFVSWSWADHGDAKGSHTPLLAATPNQNPYLYYVNLTGLLVDGQLLTDIPAGTFDVRANGSGGVFLSTTLPFTYLEAAAYTVLRRELMSRVRSQGLAPVNATAGHSLCFLTQRFSKLKVPKLALVFDGADATMELKAQNYFLPVPGGQTTCLSILPSTTGGSVLGSLLQTGRTMTYDIHGDGGGQLTFGGGQLTFAGAPAPAQVSLATLLLVWVLLF